MRTLPSTKENRLRFVGRADVQGDEAVFETVDLTREVRRREKDVKLCVDTIAAERLRRRRLEKQKGMYRC